MFTRDRFLLVTIVFVAVVFIASASVSVAIMITGRGAEPESQLPPSASNRMYHYMAILPTTNGEFFRELGDALVRSGPHSRSVLKSRHLLTETHQPPGP
jgi:flagellar basal body-associated protein FliL